MLEIKTLLIHVKEHSFDQVVLEIKKSSNPVKEQSFGQVVLSENRITLWTGLDWNGRLTSNG